MCQPFVGAPISEGWQSSPGVNEATYVNAGFGHTGAEGPGSPVPLSSKGSSEVCNTFWRRITGSPAGITEPFTQPFVTCSSGRRWLEAVIIRAFSCCPRAFRCADTSRVAVFVGLGHHRGIANVLRRRVYVVLTLPTTRVRFTRFRLEQSGFAAALCSLIRDRLVLGVWWHASFTDCNMLQLPMVRIARTCTRHQTPCCIERDARTASPITDRALLDSAKIDFCTLCGFVSERYRPTNITSWLSDTSPLCRHCCNKPYGKSAITNKHHSRVPQQHGINKLMYLNTFPKEFCIAGASALLDGIHTMRRCQA